MLRLAALILTLAACGRSGFDRRVPGDSPSDGTTVDAESCGVTAGLLGAWALESTDVSGGTIVGAPLPVVGPGRVGNALDFAGTTAFVTLPTLPVNAAAGAATTIALWFFNTAPDVDQVLFYAPPGPGAQPPRYDLWLNQTRIDAVALCINSGTSDCWGVVDPGLLNRWVHVTAVFVNGRIDGGALYIDGAAVVMGCHFGSCNGIRTVENPITLSGEDLAYSWRGKLDEVAIYDRALSAPEVAELYACATR